MTTSINIVSEEKIVKASNISCLAWGIPQIEEPHQVMIITMDVSKDFDWWLEMLDQIWLSLEHLSDFINKFKHLLFLDLERSHQRDCCLTFLWLEEFLYEEGVKSLIVVLLDQWSLDVWSELSWLFLELVN